MAEGAPVLDVSVMSRWLALFMYQQAKAARTEAWITLLNAKDAYAAAEREEESWKKEM
jgi:hypothetical protein